MVAGVSIFDGAPIGAGVAWEGAAPADCLAAGNGAAVFHRDWRDLLPIVSEGSTMIVDTPYSERTHAGHDEAVTSTRFEGEEVRQRVDRRSGAIYSVGVNRRREIDYGSWTPTDVAEFVAAWVPRVSGWFLSLTDHILAPAWAAALEAAGRYVFAPLAFVAPGSRVRLLGDGPSNWTTWIVAARPRSKEFAAWGTLPGGYVLPAGQGGAMPIVGGKPLWLIQRLVEDYSRPGDMIIDPCCGAGTTAIAAIRAGRRACVGDLSLAHAEIAARWIRNPWRPAPDIDADDRTAAQGDLWTR